MTSGGNHLIDFPENQMTKFRAVYTVKVNRRPKVCRQSFTQDSLEEKIEIINLWGSVYPTSLLNDAFVVTLSYCSNQKRINSRIKI